MRKQKYTTAINYVNFQTIHHREETKELVSEEGKSENKHIPNSFV